MRHLSAIFHETINLGFLDQQDVVHLDKIDSPELLRPDPEIGSRAPAHLTALGKAILAFLPPEELEKFLLNVNWALRTPKGSSSPEAFNEQCQRIQKQGYATDDEELCLGLRCVAVPIFDHRNYPRYAISISGPSMRMSSQRMEQMSAELLKVGKSLSQSLGHIGC
jgi:DNA-binding IclR family transcriptional regulator